MTTKFAYLGKRYWIGILDNILTIDDENIALEPFIINLSSVEGVTLQELIHSQDMNLSLKSLGINLVLELANQEDKDQFINILNWVLTNHY